MESSSSGRGRRVAQSSCLQQPPARTETRCRQGKHGPRGGAVRSPRDRETDAVHGQPWKHRDLHGLSGSSCASTEDKTTAETVSCSSAEPLAEAEIIDISFTDKERENREKTMKILASLRLYTPFSDHHCTYVEMMLDQMVEFAAAGGFQGEFTVDATECRTKYFLGNGYTYGYGQRGREALLPDGSVDPIPDWIWQCVIYPLEAAEVLPPGFVNSVVINDYKSGGQIVAHVDPPQLFARPIYTCSFFDEGGLVFGASFDAERTVPPLHNQRLPRGSCLAFDGFAANEVTHGMRPEDMMGARRVSIVLRHIYEDAPRVTAALVEEVQVDEVVRTKLMKLAQGRWRDVQGRYIYVVRSRRVLVFKVLDGAPLNVQLDATWQLEPRATGVIVNGTTLDESSTENSLFWRRKFQQRVSGSDGIIWVRLEQDLASIMDKIGL